MRITTADTLTPKETAGTIPKETAQRAEKAREVARQFEAIFAGYMLKSMRSTVGENTLFPPSMGEKIYTDMLDQEYAKVLSNQGNLGLADQIYREIQKQDNSLANIDMLQSLHSQPWALDKRLIPGMRTSAAPGTVRGDVKQWQRFIDEAGAQYNVDPRLIAAVITRESAGNPYAVSRAGAKGLMQLMDSTAADMGTPNVYNPRQNILSGTKYLRQMLDRFDGNESLALASYNAGPGAVREHGGIPPYPETQEYVRAVLKLRDTLATAPAADIKGDDHGTDR